MRILQVIPVLSSPFGGPVTVVRSISKALSRKHDVTVYTTSALDQRHDYRDSPYEVDSDGYHTVYFPRFFKSVGLDISLGMERRLREVLREYDVVHVHSWRQFQDIIVHHYAKKYGVPYVLQTHGSIPRIMAKRSLKWIYDVLFGRRVLEDASRVIALSKFEAQQLKDIGIREDKIAVVPNGVDLSEYSNLPTKGCFRNKYGIDNDERIVLFLGRIHKIKGIDILVRAFARVVEKLENARLVIVGPDDGYLSEIETLTSALKISNRAMITGPLYGRQKLEAYVDADVLALPSRYEIWGMTVLEAYACGKPVIASRVGGLKELVLEGTTGLLCEPGNVEQLTDSISCLLNNASTTRKMGLAGRRILERSYTVQKVARIYEELYERLGRTTQLA